MAFRRLTLIVVDGIFAECRLEPDAPIPSWPTAGDFFSITRTTAPWFPPCAARRTPVTSPPGVPMRLAKNGQSWQRCHPILG
jgi:hypothetical protein